MSQRVLTGFYVLGIIALCAIGTRLLSRSPRPSLVWDSVMSALSVDSVKLGMNLDDVLRLWGKSDGSSCLHWPELSHHVDLDPRGRVERIDGNTLCRNDVIVVALGQSPEQVCLALGPPERKCSEQMSWHNNRIQVLFSGRPMKVVGVIVGVYP